MKYKLRTLLGLSGVDTKENNAARQFGHFFSYIVLFALVTVIIQLVMDFYDNDVLQSPVISIGIWVVFSVEFLVCLYLVDNKKHYITTNWLNLLIILLTVPWIPWGGDWAVIFRSLRLLLFIRVMMEVFDDVFKILKRNSFGMVLIVAVVFIVIAGAVFAMIEDTSLASGLWYSLVTITTVGYGDVVPKTDEGRVFGVFLIIFGVVLFSLITANISAFLVGAEQKKIERQMLSILKATESKMKMDVMRNEEQVRILLAEIDERIEKMQLEIKTFNHDAVKQGQVLSEERYQQHSQKVQQELAKKHEELVSLLVNKSS